MSIDTTTPEPEDSMFAATPVWDRGRKGKAKSKFNFGAPAATTVAAETRTFEVAPEPTFATAEYATMGTDTALDDAPAFSPAPIANRTTVRRAGTVPPAALVAIPLGVVALGAVAWFATRPADSGVAQITPGAIASNSVVSPLPPETYEAPVAPPLAGPVPAPPPAAARAPAERIAPTRAAPARVAAVRPARAPSAATSGVDASATLPAAPQPYAPSQGFSGLGASAPPIIAVPPAAEVVPAAPPAQQPTPMAPPPQDEATPPTT